MSQIIRIGPQDVKKPVSLKRGDTLEVALPAVNIAGIWKVGYDRDLLWDEAEDSRAHWILGDSQQQTLRSFLAVAEGACLLHCEYVDVQSGHGQVKESIDFEVFIGVKPSRANKKQAAARAPLVRPTFQILEDDDDFMDDGAPVSGDTEERVRRLETENRQLQERLWSLTYRVVELAEGYASAIKGRPKIRRRS